MARKTVRGKKNRPYYVGVRKAGFHSNRLSKNGFLGHLLQVLTIIIIIIIYYLFGANVYMNIFKCALQVTLK